VEKAFFLKNGEAELLGRLLERVKSTALEKSELSLSDKEALEILASCFESTEQKKPEKQAPNISEKPERKALFLGYIISR